jgi:AAA15 family ATPase/GTPase
MLLRFRFSNFRPFRAEQESPMGAPRRLADSEGGLIGRGEGEDRAPAVAAVYGANASGKSNVLEGWRS